MAMVVGVGACGRGEVRHRVRRSAALVALVVMPFALASCQKAVDVSAFNKCGHPLEINVDDAGWYTLVTDSRRGVAAVLVELPSVRVEVRRSQAGAIKEFTVSPAELPPPPAGVDDDVEIVLEGERCPPSS